MTDRRFAGVELDRLACPGVLDGGACLPGGVYTALVRSPDGRQRVVRGCAGHLAVEVEASLSVFGAFMAEMAV